jgi:hypothetical protein
MVAKWRKNKGWTEASWTVSKQVIQTENFNPVIFWDDWNDPRDGLRYNPDKSMIRPEYSYMNHDGSVTKFNKKLKKHETIRRVRKASPRNQQ